MLSQVSMFGFYPNVTTLLSGTCYRKSACRLSVTFMHPTQPVEIFGSVFHAILYLLHWVISVQNFMEIIPGEPLCWGLNARGVSKYNVVGHVEGYISETVQSVNLLNKRTNQPLTLICMKYMYKQFKIHMYTKYKTHYTVYT